MKSVAGSLKVKSLTFSILFILCILVSGLYSSDVESRAAICDKLESAAEGPFYLDSLNRKKIYSNERGVDLNIKLRVLDGKCNALKGAVVSIWHADTKGEYSGEFGKNALNFRGFQVSDSKGYVEFETLFPGWYPGRAAHIHVKVNKNGVNLLSTQLYFRDSIVTRTYKSKWYRARGGADTVTERDGLFNMLNNKDIHVFSDRVRNGVIYVSKSFSVG